MAWLWPWWARDFAVCIQEGVQTSSPCFSAPVELYVGYYGIRNSTKSYRKYGCPVSICHNSSIRNYPYDQVRPLPLWFDDGGRGKRCRHGGGSWLWWRYLWSWSFESGEDWGKEPLNEDTCIIEIPLRSLRGWFEHSNVAVAVGNVLSWPWYCFQDFCLAFRLAEWNIFVVFARNSSHFLGPCEEPWCRVS